MPPPSNREMGMPLSWRPKNYIRRGPPTRSAAKNHSEERLKSTEIVAIVQQMMKRRVHLDTFSLERCKRLSHNRMRARCGISPTMPRRNTITQTTKITPWTTNTHWPMVVR